MKRTFLTAIALLAITVTANAQDGHYSIFDDREIAHNILNSTIVLLVMLLVSTFIIRLIKLFMTDRLRRSMLEKQTPENIINQLLPHSKSEKQMAIKWFFVLSSVSIGLAVMYLTQPVGIHSVFIMSLSTALGFFGYFLFIRNEKI